MSEHSKMGITRLRQIGWELWDPIGIRDTVSDNWQNGPADEYDSYLLRVAGMLLNGKSPEEATNYLDAVGSELMGLGKVTEASRLASSKTVEAIAAYLNAVR